MKEWVSNFKGFHTQSDSLVGVLKEGTALRIICPEEKKNNLERLFPPHPQSMKYAALENGNIGQSQHCLNSMFILDRD